MIGQDIEFDDLVKRQVDRVNKAFTRSSELDPIPAVLTLEANLYGRYASKQEQESEDESFQEKLDRITDEEIEEQVDRVLEQKKRGRSEPGSVSLTEEEFHQCRLHGYQKRFKLLIDMMQGEGMLGAKPTSERVE